jgi:heme a synthase
MSMDISINSKRIYRISFLLSVLVFINILFGPLVRATGSGLACPDWPLCHGKVLPPAEFRIYMEVGHRFYSGIISLLFLYLGFLVFKDKEQRTLYAGLTFSAGVVIILQILLGALTVTKLLDPKTVNMHLLNAVIFLTLLSLITLKSKNMTQNNFNPSKRQFYQPLGVLLFFSSLLIFIQLYMGGRVSSHYAGLACLEWPTCNTGVWFPSLAGPVGYQIQHRLMAYLILLIVSISFVQSVQKKFDRNTAWFVNISFCLVFLQILIGVFNVLFGLPTLLTALHTGVGVALFLSMFLAAYNKYYFSRESI